MSLKLQSQCVVLQAFGNTSSECIIETICEEHGKRMLNLCEEMEREKRKCP